MSKKKDDEERQLVDVKGHLKLLEEPVLPLGDASAIICFALIGKMSHGSSFPVLKVIVLCCKTSVCGDAGYLAAPKMPRHDLALML